MLTIARMRLQRDEEDGFTLIELMVVVLIIAILLAIAIPTFLGAQDRARDRGAQSNLRNGLTAAKTIATDKGGLFLSTGVTPLVEADLTAAEGSLPFVNTAPDVGDIDVISTYSPGPPAVSDIVLVTMSASGKSFGIAANNRGEVRYCKGATLADCNTYAEHTLLQW